MYFLNDSNVHMKWGRWKVFDSWLSWIQLSNTAWNKEELYYLSHKMQECFHALLALLGPLVCECDISHNRLIILLQKVQQFNFRNTVFQLTRHKLQMIDGKSIRGDFFSNSQWHQQWTPCAVRSSADKSHFGLIGCDLITSACTQFVYKDTWLTFLLSSGPAPLPLCLFLFCVQTFCIVFIYNSVFVVAAIYCSVCHLQYLSLKTLKRPNCIASCLYSFIVSSYVLCVSPSISVFWRGWASWSHSQRAWLIVGSTRPVP